MDDGVVVDVPGRNPLGSGLGVSSGVVGCGAVCCIRVRRNPLGSGLGVSSKRGDVDVRPNIRSKSRNPLGSGLGVSSE